MTPYADMTELQRVQMLAEFCGFEFSISDGQLYKGKLFGEEWNPFKDATALEEVEAAIQAHEELQYYSIAWFRSNVPYDTKWGMVHGEPHRVLTMTKANALAQMVWTLGERKG